MRIPAAIAIIAMPPHISKYFKNSIRPPHASLTLTCFHTGGLRSEDAHQNLAKDHFLNQQCNTQRKSHTRDHRDCCHNELHTRPPYLNSENAGKIGSSRARRVGLISNRLRERLAKTACHERHTVWWRIQDARRCCPKTELRQKSHSRL